MAAGKRKPRRDEHERYPAILKAAQRVLAEEGLERATMRRIAAEAGLSTAGLYIYFKNKEAILAAIRNRTFADLHASARAAAADAPTPEARLRRHLEAYLDFARANPDGFRLTFRSHLIRAPRPGRLSTPEGAIGQKAFDLMVTEIAAMIQDEGAPDEALAHSLTETAWAAIHGLSSLAIDVPRFPTSGIDTCLEQLLSMVIAGIRSHGASPPARSAG